MTDPETQFPELGRNGRTALRAMEITERLVREAKRPGFRKDAWQELAALHAVDIFQRVAANREARGWDEDVHLRHQFAVVADFSYAIRRIAEVGNLVYVDTIETVATGGDVFSVNTLGVLEFDDAGRIRKNTTYQQWDPHRVPGHVGRTGDRAGLAGTDDVTTPASNKE